MSTVLNTPTYHPEELIGRALAEGRYLLKSQLGVGSMAFVYKAWDQRLETDVVIKIPKPEKIADAGFLQRFSQERQLLVKLSHPHVVRILDIGEEGGLPYVVMQFLSGGDLLQRLKKVQKSGGQLSPDSLIKWIREVGRALDFVAEQGMIHRDVKPANIIFDEHRNPFLSDFGLTKIVCGNHLDTNSDMTAAGFIVGTPNYVAPEIVLGQSYDGRVDQYALGLIVYHMMVGEPPMQGPSSSATMVNQTRRKLPLLSDVRNDIPRSMALAVEKAIAKRQELRFGSSEEFADAVIHSLTQRRDKRPDSSVASRQRPETNARSKSGVRRRSKSQIDNQSSIDALIDLNAAPDQIRVSTGPKGLVPCPHCKEALPLKQVHGGRKGRCRRCQSRLKVSKDLTRLYLLAAITEAGEKSEAARQANASDELILGEEVFGWKLDKSQAIAVALITVTMLMAATVYITVFLNAETEAERIEQKTNKARIIEKTSE